MLSKQEWRNIEEALDRASKACEELADRIKKSSEAVEDIKTAIERISYTLKRSLNNERK